MGYDENKVSKPTPERKRRIRGAAKATEKVGRTEISENHRAYGEFGMITGWYFENPASEPYFPTGNPKVWLRFRSERGFFTDLQLNFGSMTEEELLTFKEFIDWSIEKAMPHSKSADERARQEGKDVTHARLHRRLPVFATREGGVREYVKGVPSRPDWLSQADSDDLRTVLSRMDGKGGRKVADGKASDAGSSDDSEETGSSS